MFGGSGTSLTLRDLTSEASANAELKQRLVENLGSAVQSCFRCLRCTSGCTSMKLLELKPHFIMNMAKLGLLEELLSSGTLWTCALCLKCKERCPQQSSPSDVIVSLRNVSFQRELSVPEGYLRVVSSILENGLIQQPAEVVSRDFEEFTRDSLGLPRMGNPGGVFAEILVELMSRGAG